MSNRNRFDSVYRAAVVGCGRIGCGFDDDPKRRYVSTHAKAYTTSPRTELAALCDLEADKVNRYADRYGATGRYTDVERMLSEVRPEILSICTTAETHREICEAAVDAGVRAVFCEKPIADSLEAADAMIDRCTSAGVLLAVGHQRRFDPFHQQVRDYLGQGGLGEIRQVTCYYTAGAANTGSHLFDLLRFFFGEFERVQGRHSHVIAPNPADPNIDGWLVRAGGPTVAFQACDVKDYVIFEMNILGSGGRLRLTSSGFDAQYDAVSPSPHFDGYDELLPAPCPVDPSVPREFLLNAVGHLCECLDHGREPVSSGADGRRALEIIAALRRSAEVGGSVVELGLKDRPVALVSR